MIQNQSESNSERGKDKNFDLSEEAGLTPLLGMTQSFEDSDWLVVQEGNKRALLRSIISPHFEMKCVIFLVLPYSFSHTDTLYMYIYSLFYLPCCHRRASYTNNGRVRARFRTPTFFPLRVFHKVF